MEYSRQNPSLRYTQNVVLCREMQTSGQFTGIGAFRYRKELRRLVRETGAETLLDYGCGAGRHLHNNDSRSLFAKTGIFCSSWQEALGVKSVAGYDPAADEYSTPPLGASDGVYCVDVLEHIPEDDLPWVIQEIFSYAKKFVFLTVAIVPAKKNLPNGENAHITLKSQDWWMSLIDDTAKKYPRIRYQVVLDDGVAKDHE